MATYTSHTGRPPIEQVSENPFDKLDRRITGEDDDDRTSPRLSAANSLGESGLPHNRLDISEFADEGRAAVALSPVAHNQRLPILKGQAVGGS